MNLRETTVNKLAHAIVLKENIGKFAQQATIYTQTHVNPFGCGYSIDSHGAPHRVTDNLNFFRRLLYGLPFWTIRAVVDDNGKAPVVYDETVHGETFFWLEEGE